MSPGSRTCQDGEKAVEPAELKRLTLHEDSSADMHKLHLASHATTVSIRRDCLVYEMTTLGHLSFAVPMVLILENFLIWRKIPT